MLHVRWELVCSYGARGGQHSRLELALYISLWTAGEIPLPIIRLSQTTLIEAVEAELAELSPKTRATSSYLVRLHTPNGIQLIWGVLGGGLMFSEVIF